MGRIARKGARKDFGDLTVIPPLDLENGEGEFVVFVGPSGCGKSTLLRLMAGHEAVQMDATSIGIRPEHLTLSTAAGRWSGTVGISEHFGSDTFIRVDVADIPDTMTVRMPGKVQLTYGDTVYVTPDPANVHRFGPNDLRIT